MATNSVNNDDYIPVTKDVRVFRGDYLKYHDEWNKCIGCGVLVKKVIDPIRPLTNSYYLLKNINTRKCWKVKCNRYDFFKKNHVTKYKESDISGLFATSELLQSVLRTETS
jgi:hypothetical protein